MPIESEGLAGLTLLKGLNLEGGSSDTNLGEPNNYCGLLGALATRGRKGGGELKSGGLDNGRPPLDSKLAF